MKRIALLVSFFFALTAKSQQFIQITNTIETTDGQTAYPCAWTAIDGNDSFPDLIVGNLDENIFYKNNNSTLVKTKLNNIPLSGFGIGVTVGDYNNDGFNDLFISQRYSRHYLLKGSQSGFVSDNQPVLLNFSNIGSYCASWIDYNNDGWLDLIIAIEGSSPRVYNNNNGIFSVDSNISFTKTTENYIGIACADYDNDGDQDVFFVNYFGENALYRNDGNGQFSLTQQHIIGKQGVYNGASWGDIDNDGDLDLFVTAGRNNAPAYNQLFINNGDGTLTENINSVVTKDLNIGFGSGWADVNNDGYLDLLVAHSSTFSTPDPNLFYINNGNYQFSKENNILTNSIARSRGISWGDYNNDGFLDLYVANESNDNNFFFKNTSNSGNWLKFRLEGIQSNKSAIGAKVIVKIAGKIQLREICGQTGYCSQNDLTVHFGMSNNTCADSVIIYWPSGKQCVYKNIPVNRFYFINEDCNNITPSATNFSLGNDTTVCYGNELLLSTGEPQTVWNNSQTGSSLVVKESGTYVATVSGACLSSFSDTIQIDFKDCICSLNMPNAFSPNGDNVNDLYGPVYDCPVTDFSMTIYNRWGEKVFETDDITRMWDGTFMGKEQPIGIFLYKVNYKDSLKNEKKFITGKVTLIR